MGEIADALKKANAERETGSRRRGPSYSGAAGRGAVQPEVALPLERFPDGVEPDLEVDEASHEVESGTVLESDPNLAHFEHLALKIRGELDRLGKNALAIVSALRDEGKTTLACNVAKALASISPGQRIALVDFDLRNPSIGDRFGISPEVGIDSVLAGRCSLEEAAYSVGPPPLDVYPVERAHRSAHELLAGAAFDPVMALLESKYAFVVMDTAPALIVPDAPLILRRGAACAAVARVGRSRLRRVRELVDLLPDAQFIGSIVNCAPVPKHQRGHDHYYYGREDAAEVAP